MTPQIDKHWLRNAFERAAETYDENAVLQHEVGERMIERLDLMRIDPKFILDVGAGTGRASAALIKRYRRANVLSFDIAMNMLKCAREHSTWLDKLRGRQGFVCGDVESLPLADNSIDMLFSNLTLQWCNDFDQVFNEFLRVLRPGGLLMFSTFGPGTLNELRDSWSQADGYQHVNSFIDMHDIGDALLRTGMSGPVMDSEVFTLTYPDVKSLMRDLKAIGAHNITNERARGLTGRQRMQNMINAYEDFRSDGVLPASYEVVYGHAWAPDNKAASDKSTVEVAFPQMKVLNKKDD